MTTKAKLLLIAVLLPFASIPIAFAGQASGVGDQTACFSRFGDAHPEDADNVADADIQYSATWWPVGTNCSWTVSGSDAIEWSPETRWWPTIVFYGGLGLLAASPILLILSLALPGRWSAVPMSARSVGMGFASAGLILGAIVLAWVGFVSRGPFTADSPQCAERAQANQIGEYAGWGWEPTWFPMGFTCTYDLVDGERRELPTTDWGTTYAFYSAPLLIAAAAAIIMTDVRRNRRIARALMAAGSGANH